MNNEFFDPMGENNTPKEEFVTPEAENVASDIDAVTPESEAVVPDSDAVTPEVVYVTPAEETFSDPPVTEEADIREDNFSEEILPADYTAPESTVKNDVYENNPPLSPEGNPATPEVIAPNVYAPNYGPVPPQTYYYYPQSVEPPKKRSKGATAFLVCLWVLVGLFVLGFFVLCGYVAGQTIAEGSNAPTLFEEHERTEPTDPDDPSYTLPGGVIPNDDSEDAYTQNGAVKLHSYPIDKNNSDKYTTKYAYNKVSESTIGVACYKKGGMATEESLVSQGTGIILTEDGYIATNSHVIGDSRTLYSVQVVTSDGTVYEAKVIGYDSRTDLAVLKINARGLTPADFCDSDLVEVGEDVIAVGNPGGLEFQNSLTRGVVSALDRELSLSSQVTYIQTDAAINPGNSGGPLCNMYGQVIGINTAKINDASFEGMGFAIPSRTVKEIVDDLMTQGYVSDRVRLGISGQAMSSTMAQYYNTPTGILVGEISEGGPCDGTELQINDIITEIDGEEISDFGDVYAILGEHKPGDKVVLSVYRMNSRDTFEITITLMADQGETQQ